MSRLLMILCCLVILVQAVPAETLEQYLSDKIVADYRLDPEKVRITVVRSGLKNTEVDGFEVEAYPVTHAEPRGRFPMKVELYRDGSRVEKGSVSLDIRIFADLPIPIQNIKRHELLTEDMFTYKRFDITTITEKLLTDPSQWEGCRAKHNLTADRYIPMRRVEKLPDVENGQSVMIVGNGGFLEIRARGQALQNGAIGEKIKVKNVDSRKILTATVTAPGVVEITI